MTTRTTKPQAPAGPISLQRLDDAELTIDIEGLTPLIPHRWSEKALRQMRNKQFGNPSAGREPKNPEEEALASCYWLQPDVPGMPATAFKSATIDGARFFPAITMAELKSTIFVKGVGPDQLVEITGDPLLREDTPRNSGGTADLRYRYQFMPWRAQLTVRFVPTQLTADSVVALVDAGGRGGVGDWRPNAPKSKTGTFGTYRVV
jgi:hypothetical protein